MQTVFTIGILVYIGLMRLFRTFSIVSMEVVIMKKLVLVLSVLFIPAVQAINVYQVLDKLGSCFDLIISKGRLSEKDEKLFKEVASSLGIENRDIKPRNSGLLLRLMSGYNNALAMQHLNRVYFNASCLKKMSDGHKKFLMGHELTHHQKNHVWKRAALAVPMWFAQKGIGKLTRPVEKEDKKHFNWKTFKKEEGPVDVQRHSPVYYRYFSEGFQIPMLVDFSLKSLIMAQFCQRQETEADELAIRNAGATAEDGVACLQQIYYPDTKDWPLYAKVMAVMSRILMPIMSLPVIKQHMPHLVSFKERAEHLRGLKKHVHIENA